MNKEVTIKYYPIKTSAIVILAIMSTFLIVGIRSNILLHKEISCVLKLESVDKEAEKLKELIEKAHFAFDSGTLTYMVTIIVTLLITLIGYRINKIERLIEENRLLKEQIETYVYKSNHYSILLTKIESIYHLTIMCQNSAEGIHTQVGGKNYKQVGSLCSRITVHIEKTEDILNSKKRFFLTQEEKITLSTYIDDISESLERTEKLLEKDKSPIAGILSKIQLEMEFIRYDIEDIETNKITSYTHS